MSETRFTEDHEWVRIEGDVATVGITEYAQEQLGDIVFVDLPEAGAEMAQGDEAAVIESVKAASDIYAPITGEVGEVNDSLDAEPAIVNQDAQGEGWLFTMSISDSGELDNLMDADAYKAFVAKL
ncbi:MAG: glycine cleavage system protein GcvH [Rhodospirillaceae bacterium]|nr:glycine cleavage system protein GcvH [Rhodospirillaceae bacterium]MDD9915647.1 glycine cleavage system protein GcvH [Rhodospirillaceae bacterium]MDD9929117.1 glycine cleavage system protein GcvH [Rhodospirillaceae bacterium]